MSLDEKRILELLNTATEPADSPGFDKIAAKSIPYKNANKNEKPPRKYNLKRRLVALAAAAAILLGIFGGARIVKFIRIEASPYSNVLKAFEKYNRAQVQFSLSFAGLFGAKSADMAGELVTNDAGMSDRFEDGTVVESKIQSNEVDYDEGTDSESANDFSGTNVQVEGVDEADIVKTDGKFFYIQSKSGLLRIVDAAGMELVSEIKAADKFHPLELYLSGDLLVQLGQDFSEAGGITEDYYDSYYSKYKDIKTKIIVFNKKDPENPQKTGEFTQDGSLISSRMVDGNIYLVSGYRINDISGANVSNIEEYVPVISVQGKDSTKSQCVPAESIEIMDSDPTEYTIVSGMNVRDLNKISTQTILGAGNNIYASTEKIYVYGSRYNGGATAIISLKISGGAVEKSASGEVPGHLLNQFCLDEYKGYLRVGSSGDGNSVYVLDEALKIAGKINNLAPGENLKSVRFMGDTGYVVTFMQVDPLFAIDLSNPKKPILLGELKIPGFSTYMHPYDQNTIIGIGFDADPYSGRSTALKLSMFDVKDPANMRESRSLTFGGSMFDSEALYDHRAVLFSKEKNLLVIPAEYDSTEQNGEIINYNGAIVVYIDENKMRQTALISHVGEGSKSGEDLRIRRVIYVGDKLYSFSEAMVMCVSLKDFSLIGKVEFSGTVSSGNEDIPVITP